MTAAKRLPEVVEQGLDDLAHGIDVLIEDPPETRQRTADRICRYVEGLTGDAVRQLQYEAQLFAALGRDPEPVRAAFARFAVEAGPTIGALAAKREAAVRSGQAGGAARRAAAAQNLTPLQRAVLDAEERLGIDASSAAISAHLEVSGVFRGSSRQSVNSARKQLRAKGLAACEKGRNRS
jgi:hypothetical protein